MHYPEESYQQVVGSQQMTIVHLTQLAQSQAMQIERLELKCALADAERSAKQEDSAKPDDAVEALPEVPDFPEDDATEQVAAKAVQYW